MRSERQATLDPQEPLQRVSVPHGSTGPVVIEVGVDFPLLGGALTQPISPPTQVVVGVGAAVEMVRVGAVEADVDEGSCDAKDARQVGAAHDTVGHTVPFQEVEDDFLVPARVAEFHGDLPPRGSVTQKILQPGKIAGKLWRKLYQHDAELVPEIMETAVHPFHPR